jgi:acetyl esterase/lipase
MALGIDAQVMAELGPLLEAIGETQPLAIGDVENRRVNGHRMFDCVASTWKPVAGVQVDRYTVTTADGATLDLSWYRTQAGLGPSPEARGPGSAVLYLHGGGMIFGLEHIGRIYDHAVRDYVASSGGPMLMVDYRIAPEHPHPTPVEDCYGALQWLADNAATLGVDPARIGVMGDSAGGGLAAGVCLLARDRDGPSIAQQLLIYPMLDDRAHPLDPQLVPFLTWTYDDNVTGWAALLGDAAGTDAVSPYAAPARATDLSGLPDTYIDVGDLDIFRDEDITYARRLSDAGVPTELHLLPGCPHAFEALARGADVSQRAINDRLRRLRSL